MADTFSYLDEAKDFEPSEAFAHLRSECPLHRVEQHDPPFYVLSRFSDVVGVLKQPDLWGNRDGPGVFYQEAGRPRFFGQPRPRPAPPGAAARLPPHRHRPPGAAGHRAGRRAARSRSCPPARATSSSSTRRRSRPSSSASCWASVRNTATTSTTGAWLRCPR